ncbi:MAG: hypothetical protein J6P83_06750 [Bacteroidales bacterium]|nr:hypothetical protein [Bacteroidales bacterium]
MNNKTLIIGHHPISQSIAEQYRTMGMGITAYHNFGAVPDGMTCHELCVLPNREVADHDTLQALETFAMSYPETPEGRSKPVCHLLLHDKVTLWLLQTLDLYPEIHKKFELYAFTMEDQWAKNVFCGLGNGNSYPPLDREKIDGNSNKTVHLVIAGFSDLGESLALHTALIAHFPNYVRNQALRTRITIIDKDLTARKDAFIQRYANLFEHSHYRCIDLKQHNMTLYHEPVYNASREDFVDVEWEFVDGDFYDPLLQRKLQLWADSKEQLLTLALCDADTNSNFDRAFALPKSIYQNDITVFVATERSAMLGKVRETEGYHNLYPIGMDDCGYDVRLPLLQMAKRLNYFYTCSYGQEGTPTNMPVEKVEAAWRNLQTFSMRYSNIYNVMTVATKMRSLGHEEKDWDKFFALTQEEIETLSAVEHNRWSVERLILGFRPPTDTEREEIRENIEAFITAKATGQEQPEQDLKNVYKKKKIHYDLCSYRELREDKTGQDVRLYDYDLTACIPLIAQSFKETQL